MLRLISLGTEVELKPGGKLNQRENHDSLLKQGLLPPDVLRNTVRDVFVAERL